MFPTKAKFPTIILKNTVERRKLNAVAAMLEATATMNEQYWVQEVYYGDWEHHDVLWTTIVEVAKGRQHRRMLTLDEWQEIIGATSISGLAEIAERIKKKPRQ